MDPAWPLPADLTVQASAVWDEVRSAVGNGPFVILGECIAAKLAMEIARLSGRPDSPSARAAILLDPDPLRSRDGAGQSLQNGTGSLPDRIARYYSLLSLWNPEPIGTAIHLILSSDNRDTAILEDDWSRMAHSGFQIHRVRGNHDTYIRKHAAETAAVIRNILRSCLPHNGGQARKSLPTRLARIFSGFARPITSATPK